VAGGEALRRLYAEVGWKIDDAPLRKLDKILDDLKKSMLGGSVERFEEELAEAGEEAKDLGKELKKTGNIASTAMDDAAGGARRLKRETRDAGDEAERSRRKFQRFGDALTRISRSMTSGIWRMSTSLLRAPFSLPGMIIGGAATYGAVRYGLMNPLRMASEFEQAEIAFTTMLGSAEKAREFIDEMNRFAVETPFDVAGVQDAAKRMLAFGFKQEQIIPYLTAIGNAAAGLGGGTDLIDRISLAIGQMQAKAKVSAEEMLQLTEAGIPAWEILAQKMNKTTREVMDLSSKGLIPASKAIEMLIEGMNERFPNMLQKQAESLDGLKNQIVETFNLVVVKRWGDGLARALKPRFQQLNRWIEDNDDKIQRWGKALEKTAFEGLDYLLKQAERAFGYIRVNYLENEEFQSLPFDKKIEKVFGDIEAKFDKWYSGGGKKKIEESAQKFVDFTLGVLEDNLPKVASMGSKLGSSLGSGLWDGLQKKIEEHPILSVLLSTGAGALVGARFGPVGALVGGTIGLGASVGELINIQLEKREQKVEEEWKQRYDRPPNVPLYEATEILPRSMVNIPGHSDGLPYVPNDDYIARLHEGERVLTKQENREYTKGRAAQSVTPAISATINVNVSGTAAAGGSAAVKAAAKQGAREGLEEFWRSLRRNNPAILEV
jgi:tape measure domain